MSIWSEPDGLDEALGEGSIAVVVCGSKVSLVGIRDRGLLAVENGDGGPPFGADGGRQNVPVCAGAFASLAFQDFPPAW